MSVMIDYSKAFDTIDHESLDDKKSTRLPMYFGVPQGGLILIYWIPILRLIVIL